MQVINLINKEKSGIVYDIITFSDGEKHIKLISEVDRKDKVTVVCRITSMDELFILSQVGDILNRMEVEWALIITYLMGMRMDRVMSFNEAFSLKIVSNIINDLKASAVFIVEPHSDRTLKLINNSQALMNHFMLMAQNDDKHKNIIVFPDAGAKLRYAGDVSGDVPILTCHKKRDVATGKLSGFGLDNPEILDQYPDYDGFFMIDDLCDGGGTFCGMAEILKEVRPNFHKTLAITHAVNVRGIYKIADAFDTVYITDSYKDWELDQYIASDENKNVVVLATEQYYYNI